MKDVKTAVLGYLRETYEGDESYIVVAVLREYDPAVEACIPWEWQYDSDLRESCESEAIPTHVARVVTTCEGLELVDGTPQYMIVGEDGTIQSVWEDIYDGNQPNYYGGPLHSDGRFQGGTEWAMELGGDTIHQEPLRK